MRLASRSSRSSGSLTPSTVLERSPTPITSRPPAELAKATMVALTHTILGEDAAAHEWIEISAGPGEPVTMTLQADMRALLVHRAGRHDEAAKTLTDSTPGHVRAAGADQAIRMLCSALAGDAPPAKAIRALKAMEQRVPPLQFDQTRRKRLLLWYSMLGDLDSAYDVMHRSFRSASWIHSLLAALWGAGRL